MKPSRLRLHQLAAAGADRFLAACNRVDAVGDIHPFGLVEYRSGEWFEETTDEPIWSVAYGRPQRQSAEPTRLALLKYEKQLLVDGRIEALPDPRGADGKRLVGALRDIRQIGAHLFVCGSEGQIYRRDADCWRLLRDDLLVSRHGNHPDKMYMILGGVSETELYVGQWRGCDFWNGRELIQLADIPSAVTDIFVESETRVWLCGWHGLLLCGNHRDGFRSAVADPDDISFETITGFDGRIWLTTQSELYVLEHSTLVRVRPDIEPLFRVDQAGGVLWAIGRYNILRYDGTRWDQVEPPSADGPWGRH